MKLATRERNVIRFPVSNVAVATEALPTSNLSDELTLLMHSRIESCSERNAQVVPVSYHPLFAAAQLCFEDHRPLVLSPDMIWLTLIQGVAAHINLNPERLRRELVRHDGKEEITVRRDEFRPGLPENPWPEVFAEFSLEIRKRIGSYHALFVDAFSTTGPVEIAAFEVGLMDALQSYFDFRLLSLCGIPEITLEGRTEDWQRIADKLRDIEKLGLSFWTTKLEPVISEFVRASQGDIDSDFWRSLYKFEDQSGGPYITGWLTHLLPYVNGYKPDPSGMVPMSRSRPGQRTLVPNPVFDDDNKDKGPFEGVATHDLPSGISKVPFVWDYLLKRFDYEFLAGFVGVTQNARTLALRPKIGWAVRPAAASLITINTA